MANVLFIDAHNIAPHLETAFELAKRHLDAGDHVTYVFAGYDVPYREFLAHSRLERALFRSHMPERRAARLIASERFTFVPHVDVRLQEHEIEPPLTLEELKAWTYDGADLGMGVASSLIGGSYNSRFDPSAHRRLVADALRGSVALYEASKRLIAEHEPDLMYVFNGRLCHTRAILRAAERMGVELRVHDRGADKDRFVARPFVPHDRERIQGEIEETWERRGPDAEAEAHRWYRERRNGQPRDWWSFTALQERWRLPALPTGKRIATYFSSSDDEFAAIGEAFKWEGWRDQLDAVAGLIDVASKLPDLHLVIRLHPHLLKKHPDDMARWLEAAKAGGVAQVIEPGSPVDSYALVEASDVVVTAGSTVGMEAVYWGRPSVLLGPSDYDLLGAVHLARSRERLYELLSDPDLPVDPASALPYGYYRGTFGERFRYYEATGLFSGRFMGVDVQELPGFANALSRARRALVSAARSLTAGRAAGRRVSSGVPR